jgi:hypothetical protein
VITVVSFNSRITAILVQSVNDSMRGVNEGSPQA